MDLDALAKFESWCFWPCSLNMFLARRDASKDTMSSPRSEPVSSPTSRVLLPAAPDSPPLLSLPADQPVFFSEESPRASTSPEKKARWAKPSMPKSISKWKESLRPLFPSANKNTTSATPSSQDRKEEEIDSPRRGRLHTGAPPRTAKKEDPSNESPSQSPEKDFSSTWPSLPSTAPYISSPNSPTTSFSPVAPASARSPEKKPMTPLRPGTGFGGTKDLT